MIHLLSSVLTDFLCRSGIVPEDDREIYAYGYEILISSIIGIASVMVIGALLGVFAETLVFIVVFISTRQTCGGYHADSYIKCISVYITNYIMVIGLTLCLLETYSLFVWLIMTIPAASAVIGFAPMENENKPMTDDEKKINRRRALLITGLCIALSGGLLSVSARFSLLISSTLLSTAMLMIFGQQPAEND